jgi:hypothetical protein
MKVEFTKFDKTSNWVYGTVNSGEYGFEAKLFDEGSEYGINNGRVSKLSIWNEKNRQEEQDFLKASIVNYDRGWDIKPKKGYKEIFDAVMQLLENSPKRFENE